MQVEELPARVAAAGAAERVFGYAEAAVHLQRAIELCQAAPAAADAAQAAGISVPRLYVRAMDALALSGDGVHAGALAEEAYRRFADHPDHATVAVILQRAALFRGDRGARRRAPADPGGAAAVRARPTRQPITLTP